ncbi:MAG TPA: hypothetical protein VM103_01050 [Candidatus Paceibacterota bacterium]|nr:hypothetical protein [Candidatus Paceibacterota bacterium]
MAESSPNSEDTRSALERARERLYSTQSTPVDVRDQELHAPQAPELPHVWETSQEKPLIHTRHVHLAAIFFGITLSFFVLAAGVAAYLLYFGGNTVSVNNVAISVQGPSTIAGGDTVPLQITITNRNPAPVTHATIDVTFPSGTRSFENVFQDYPRYAEDLGTIAPGQTVTRSLKAIIFGQEGEAVSIPVSFTFGTPNSSATFRKPSTHELTITSSPLSLTVAAPTETVSGQTFNVALSVRSNAQTSIGNVVLGAAFPFGFSILSSSVPLQNGSFSLGTLKPGDTRTITITGALSGTENGKRAFRFSIGTSKGADDPTIAITYLTQQTDIAINAPFISTSIAINGNKTESAVLTSGARSTVTISYTNTLATAITNAEVDVQVSGGAVDYSSIQGGRGFYRSSDHTVAFTSDNDSTLARLEPGATGIGTFTFSTLSGSALRDPTVTFTVSVSGTRTGEANVPEVVTASKVVTVKVASAIGFTAQSLHSSGPFANTGPIPPVANVPTTYTILWSIQNAANATADAVVSTVLPSYITFTNVISPGADISYNSSTRTVTWRAGDLMANTVSQGAFQVSLAPSTSQKGSAPQLTGKASFSTYDRFAGIPLTLTADPVTTETKGDPGYVSANGRVQ